ncbi:MAG: hypothetical protein KAS32_29790 [Candidatus Peribacteraceae bacterium]|nr:hypothetical protein [Candidatus Peribacteraceae bacterium]
MRGRAFRRFQLAKKKKSILMYGCNCSTCRNKDKRLVGIHARTPKTCSCGMCGNRRKHDGATRKERLFIEMSNKEMVEVLQRKMA